MIIFTSLDFLINTQLIYCYYT